MLKQRCSEFVLRCDCGEEGQLLKRCELFTSVCREVSSSSESSGLDRHMTSASCCLIPVDDDDVDGDEDDDDDDAALGAPVLVKGLLLLDSWAREA